MKVFRIHMEQHGANGRLNDQGSIDVRARNAKEAIRRAESHARANGFYFVKSRPVEITSLEIVSRELV